MIVVVSLYCATSDIRMLCLSPDNYGSIYVYVMDTGFFCFQFIIAYDGVGLVVTTLCNCEVPDTSSYQVRGEKLHPRSGH